MLIVTLKDRECLMIQKESGETIRLIVNKKNGRVRFMIHAPKEVSVARTELKNK